MSALLKLAARSPTRPILPTSPMVARRLTEQAEKREREEVERRKSEEVERRWREMVEKRSRPSTIRLVQAPTDRTPMEVEFESKPDGIVWNKAKGVYEPCFNPFTRLRCGPYDVKALAKPSPSIAPVAPVAAASSSSSRLILPKFNPIIFPEPAFPTVYPFTGLFDSPGTQAMRARTTTAPASLPTAAPALTTTTTTSSSRVLDPFTYFGMGPTQRNATTSVRAVAPQPESRTNARHNVGAQTQKPTDARPSVSKATTATSRKRSPPPPSSSARASAAHSSSRVSPRQQAGAQAVIAGSRPRVNAQPSSVGNEGKPLPSAPSSNSWILVSPKKTKSVRKSTRKSQRSSPSGTKPAVPSKQAGVATKPKVTEAEAAAVKEVKEARRYFTTVPTSPEVSYAQVVSPRPRSSPPPPPRARLEVAQIPPFRGQRAQGGKISNEVRGALPGGRNPFETPKTRGYPRFVTPPPRAVPKAVEEVEEMQEILISPKDLLQGKGKGKKARRGRKASRSPAALVEPREEARPAKVANTADRSRTVPLQSTRRSTTPPTACSRGPVAPVRPAQSAQVEEGRFYLPLPPQLSAISLADFASKDSPVSGNTGALYAFAKSQFARSKLALSIAPSPTSSNQNGRSFSSRGDPALRELSKLVKTLRKREDQHKQQVATLVERVDCLEGTLATSEALVASLEASVLEQYQANVLLKEQCEALSEESIDFEECLQALTALQEENEDLKIKLQAKDSALQISRRGRIREREAVDLREPSPSDWIIQEEDEGIELGDTRQVCRPRDDPTDLFGQDFDDERYQRGLEAGVIGQVELAAYLRNGILRPSAEGGFEMASAPHHRVDVAKAWEIPEDTVLDDEDEFF